MVYVDAFTSMKTRVVQQAPDNTLARGSSFRSTIQHSLLAWSLCVRVVVASQGEQKGELFEGCQRRIAIIHGFIAYASIGKD